MISYCSRIVLLALPLFTFQLSAQDTLMVLFGQVQDVTSGEKVSPLTVEAINVDDSTIVIPAVIKADGTYAVYLQEEGTYQVVYDSPNHVPKRVEIELKGPNKRQWKRGYGMNADISLFREIPDVDLTLDHKPYGRSRYVPARDNFEWDPAYSKAMRDEINNANKLYKQRLDASK